MQKASPTKTFHAVPNKVGCDCALCPFMRLNTLEKILACLQNEAPEVRVPEDIRVRALRPLERMLELSVSAS